jgi:hypothetical protein
MEYVVPSPRPAQPTRSPAHVLGRVLARTGVGLWQRKGTLLLGAVTVAALGTVGVLSGAATSTSAAQPAPLDSGTACADAAIAAIAQKTSTTVQQAYDCMEPSFQQRVPETQFAAQFGGAQAQPSTTAAPKAARVADYHGADGGQMVYYALSTGDQSVGYIVYLDAQGKISKVE